MLYQRINLAYKYQMHAVTCTCNIPGQALRLQTRSIIQRYNSRYWYLIDCDYNTVVSIDSAVVNAVFVLRKPFSSGDLY